MLVADGVYGLTVVAETTSPAYWVLCLVAAGVLLAATPLRLRTPSSAAMSLATAGTATTGLLAGYAVLNGLA